MDSDGFQGLRIDPEFSGLIAPLSMSEYRFLEESIRMEGCREPIIVWGNTIVDGHNRYQICSRWGIHFQTRSIDFNDRDEAISWICSTQLGRRNISEETRKYLIGKQFDAEKMIRRRKARTEGTFRAPKDELPSAETVSLVEQSRQPKNPTAERIAEDYHLAHSTVEKYAVYSRALDSIGHKSPPMLPKILSGKYKISHENVIMLARMDAASVQRLEDRLEKREDSTAFVPFSISREQISDCFQGNDVPILHPEIKNMPAFDPDAEINGLALTVPTWISLVSRTRTSIDLGIISPGARKRLETVLRDLMDNIGVILRMIRSDDSDI